MIFQYVSYFGLCEATCVAAEGWVGIDYSSSLQSHICKQTTNDTLISQDGISLFQLDIFIYIYTMLHIKLNV